MTTEQPQQEWTDEELEGFTEKLQTWGSTLSSKEQGLLLTILSRAAGASDVQGFVNPTESISFAYEKIKISALRDPSAATATLFSPGQSGQLLPAVREIARG